MDEKTALVISITALLAALFLSWNPNYLGQALQQDRTQEENLPGQGSMSCATNADCTDANPCTQDNCNQERHVCEWPPGNEGAACGRDNSGYYNGTCHDGVCVANQNRKSCTTARDCRGPISPFSVCQNSDCINGVCVANPASMEGQPCGDFGHFGICRNGVCSTVGMTCQSDPDCSYLSVFYPGTDKSCLDFVCRMDEAAGTKICKPIHRIPIGGACSTGKPPKVCNAEGQCV